MATLPPARPPVSTSYTMDGAVDDGDAEYEPLGALALSRLKAQGPVADRFMRDNASALALLGERLGADGGISDQAVAGAQVVAVLDHGEFCRLHAACVAATTLRGTPQLRVVSMQVPTIGHVVVAIPATNSVRTYALSDKSTSRSDCIEKIVMVTWMVALCDRVVCVATCVGAPVGRDGRKADIAVPVGVCSPLAAVEAMEGVTGIPRTAPAFLFPAFSVPMTMEGVIKAVATLPRGVDFSTLKITTALPRIRLSRVVAGVLSSA